MKRKRAALPPNDPQLAMALRSRVRFILSALPKGRGLSKADLRVKLEGAPFGFAISNNDPNELDEAIEWNHARNFVDFTSNDMEVELWFLTPKGAARG